MHWKELIGSDDYLNKKWSIWVPKIVQKAKLETSNRNTIFQNFSAAIDWLSSMTYEELLKCEFH